MYAKFDQDNFLVCWLLFRLWSLKQLIKFMHGLSVNGAVFISKSGEHLVGENRDIPRQCPICLIS